MDDPEFEGLDHQLAAAASERDNNGFTPFMVACSCGFIQILMELKDAGADACATAIHGSNAVHFAAQNGHLDILRALQGWNVDLNATTNNGHNAVHLAAQSGHLDILRALQGWNVDLDAPPYQY